ncbi:polyketide cyclase / dehydrase and lipid transport [Halalkalicoccus paucihalophilus]|uniref:Polyketide cyclase / dehydrase and lipid transport n=1 Tax=Halalkalicoccus paucihalophilus TaxID=1008153 RepID=A0A151ADC3_9EURY|nr:SRPBCC family protein [Halalkalicoccus paucihalophilus]KYH25665.1 polyketide cyclase / dehydrase and lipid transport [Halalkalicoccus paucihalophilus]
MNRFRGITGRTVDVVRPVDAPAEVVWNLLVDTRRWPEWGPSITDVECADRRIESGTTGRVRLVGGIWIPFEVTYRDAYRWTWEVAGIPATGHRVEPYNGSCLAVFEVPVLAAGYAPVCRLALSRIADLAE